MNHALIAAAAGFLSGRGTSFLDALLKPAATAMGEDLLQRYRSYTGKNVADVLDAASAMLEESPATHQVPGRILFPILEHCSIEDDAEMKTRWAALLANAAVGNKVLPAYAEILRQLVPLQAKMLDWMYKRYTVGIQNFHCSVMQPEVGLDDATYALLITDLHRLQLIDGTREIKTIPNLGEGMSGSLTGGTIFPLTTATVYANTILTSLGLAFIAACLPPA